MANLIKIMRNVLEKAPIKVAVNSLFIIVALFTAEPCFAQHSDTVSYTYDSLDRLTRVTYSSGGSILYTYDAAGNRTAIQVSGVAIFGFSSMTPQVGRVTGGQQIKLNGSFAGLSTVMMGGVSASWSYSNGTSEITITTPPHAVGAVSIDLIPSVGAPISKANAFAYLPITFTDNTLVARVTTAKAQHIVELRQAVDALRIVAGLSPAVWTDTVLVPKSTIIQTTHIQKLRTYLEEAAVRLGYTTRPYTDPTLSGLSINRVHIEELRQRIRDIAH
jgi:hypothetical protein